MPGRREYRPGHLRRPAPKSSRSQLIQEAEDIEIDEAPSWMQRERRRQERQHGDNDESHGY